MSTALLKELEVEIGQLRETIAETLDLLGDLTPADAASLLPTFRLLRLSWENYRESVRETVEGDDSGSKSRAGRQHLARLTALLRTLANSAIDMYAVMANRCSDSQAVHLERMLKRFIELWRRQCQVNQNYLLATDHLDQEGG